MTGSVARLAPLLGRAAELKLVERALRGPDAVGCVLEGLEGIGKTAIARHALRAAQARGCEVAHVIATSAARSVQLGAFVQLIGEPSLHDNTYAAVRERLGELARDRRLVVLVDDVHLLDDASAALMLDVSASMSIAWVLTLRRGEVPSDAVIALWKERALTHIAVDPLDRSVFAQLLTTELGGAVSPWALDQLLDVSARRPFEVLERARAAVAAGDLERHDGDWELVGPLVVPPSLLTLVQGSLDRMPTRDRELLTAVVLCEPLPLEVVEEVWSARSLDRLEHAGLVVLERPAEALATPIVPSGSPADNGYVVRAAQPTYAEAVLARVGERQRRRVYLQAAEALERLGGNPVLVATWRHRAGLPVFADRLLEAAKGAFSTGEYGRCGELAGAAWKLERSFDAGHLLGFAQGQLGNCEAAERTLAETERFVASERELALLTLTRAEIRSRGLGDRAGSAALYRAAEARLSDKQWRAELTAHRAMEVLLDGDVAKALAEVEPLLDVSVYGDRAFVAASYTAGLALVHAGRSSDATAVATRALPIHEAIWHEGPMSEPGVHHLVTLFAMLGAGQLAEAEPLLELGRQLTQDAEPRYAFAWVSYFSGRAAVRQARFDRAAGHFAVASSIFQESRRTDAAAWCHAGMALCAALQGRAGAAQRHLARSADLLAFGPGLNASWRTEALGWFDVVDGKPDVARDRFLTGARAARDVGDLLGASHLLVALARNGGAADALAELEAIAPDLQGELITWQVRFVRAVRSPNEVAEALVVAEACHARGMNLEAAELTARVAAALRRRGEKREAARVAEAAQARLRACEGASTPLLADVPALAELTDRELEVARLAAGRLSSREIATRLGIAPRTVDNHLSRVYMKAGISGRGELRQVLADDSA